jgi:hypothetical protein
MLLIIFANTNYPNTVRFEVFTAVTMKKAVFWDVAPCRNCVNRRFRGTYRLHLQGKRLEIRERTSRAGATDWILILASSHLPHPERGISTPIDGRKSMTNRGMYSSTIKIVGTWYSPNSGFCLEPETVCTGFPHYEYYSYSEIKLRT